MAKDSEILVIGAGVIGLCIALRLLREGREVLLIDRDEPGRGASGGNAGVFATYECVPIGTPSVWKALPRLLVDSMSPLSISLTALPRLTPWLMRFARASVASRAVKNAATLAALLENSLSAFIPLLELSGACPLLRRSGALHLFRSEDELAAAAWSIDLRRRLGISFSLLGRAELARLEPRLPPDYACGILFPEAAHLTDPYELMRRLTLTFLAQGGHIVRANIETLRCSAKGITLTTRGATLRGETAVVALGAWSAQLARQIGDRLPLETQRGYHVEFPTSAPLLNRPVCPVGLGFYLSPMTGRLRAAGTVELSSLKRAANPRRLKLIEESARRVIPGLPAAQSKWLGFRPSFPDSLPAIGRSPHARNVIYACGHGHLGLTLAAETARIVSNLIVNDRDSPELAAVSPARFR